MIPLTHLEGRRVAVFGLGRSGLSAARALQAGGATAILADDNEDQLARLAQQGWETADLTAGSWPDIDLLCLSPGVPHLYPAPHPVVSAAWGEGVPVDNDVGLFFAELSRSPTRIVAITGTNGKSTTTALAGHLLDHGGISTQIGGNIGRGVFDLDPPSEGDAIVLELSSYQTDLARTLSPDVAVFLNLSPDHLDRHGGLGGYFAAKARLFAPQPERPQGPALSVIGVDEPEGRSLANRVRAGRMPGDHVIAISSQRSLLGAGISVYADGDGIALGQSGRVEGHFSLADAPTLQGRHNAQNAAAAVAVARHLGLSDAVIQSGLEAFPGLAHRMEILGRKHGVLFVNDSKATNADAAAQAMATFPRFIWIAGGQAKEGGIQSLNPFLGSVRHAFLIGQDGPALARELGDAAPHSVVTGLDEAFAQAVAAAHATETPVVLFSPACASFDQYADFEQRGEAFRSLFNALDGDS
jgi:UDP-N-acetylmuramoylalanine--D-glutamate ligase